MKIWEAVQMLEQMDQTKEVTVTFGVDKVSTSNKAKTNHVIDSALWQDQVEKANKCFEIKMHPSWPKAVYFNPNNSDKVWAQ